MTLRQKPYWLDSGTEPCSGCTHLYVYELEMRCAGCDRGLCQHCVVRHRIARETWCAECWAEEQGGAGSGRSD